MSEHFKGKQLPPSLPLTLSPSVTAPAISLPSPTLPSLPGWLPLQITGREESRLRLAGQTVGHPLGRSSPATPAVCVGPGMGAGHGQAAGGWSPGLKPELRVMGEKAMSVMFGFCLEDQQNL